MAQPNLNSSQELLYKFFIKKIIFIDNNQLFVHFEATLALPILKICELFKNLGIPLTQINLYKDKNKEHIEVISAPLPKQINITNVEYILTHALNHLIPIKCRLYRFIPYEDFTYKQVLFLQAMVHYLDQLLPEKREERIVKTLLRYPKLVAAISNSFFTKKQHQKQIDELSKQRDKIFQIRSLALKGFCP